MPKFHKREKGKISNGANPNNQLPYSLSTAWNYRNQKNAKDIVDEIKSLGFSSIELNFALTKTQANDFVKLKDSGYINISSTHNFCPLPRGVDPKDASPEYYSLSSLDDDERFLAIRFTKKSMDFAKKAGANVLIIHLGRVEMKDKTKMLFGIKNKKEFEMETAKTLRERQRKARPFLDKATESLGEILEYAEIVDLNIAIENRYYIKELPSLSEFKTIFKAIEDKRLFYWHDTGHAQLYENLRVLRHEDYLKTLSNRLIGVHLHDIIRFDDHRAPGCGEFDFKRLKPYLKPNTIKVIEAHRKATAREVKDSISYLNKALEG